MSLEGLIVALTLTAILGLWVGAPLLNRNLRAARDSTAAHKQRERLIAHYERLLNNIRDLDEDHATGKIETDDYDTEREALVERAVQVLMALDSLAVGEAQPDGHLKAASRAEAEIDASLDEQIEAAVAAYRRSTAEKTKNGAGSVAVKS